MFRPLRYILDRTVKTGHFTLIDADGRAYGFGDHTGPRIVARVTDRQTERQLAFDPALAIGEAYMDRRLQLEQGTIYDLFDVLASNLEGITWPRWTYALEKLRFQTRKLHQFNPRPRAKKNVAHHYDLDGSLYDLFLDEDRQYSCAYFEHEDMSLDAAQSAKKRHLASKLALRDGMRVLDIGSGWGGLALYLGKTAHVEVTGITLSENQLKVSRERAQAEGLSKAVKFELCDYRDLDESFDRIVSVGMFEHVGLIHYRTFFDSIARLLKPEGIAVLHSIGRFGGPAPMNPFITRYIFPGAYLQSLSEVLPAIERKSLLVTDVETLRLHYAFTLRHWRQRFRANWNTAVDRFGERFCRMWEAYLAMCETGFRYQGLMVFQIQLAKDVEALPLTRDYMFDAERELRARDGQQAPSKRPRTVARERTG